MAKAIGTAALVGEPTLFDTLDATVDRHGVVRIYGHIGSVSHLVAHLDPAAARALAEQVAVDVVPKRTGRRPVQRNGLATVTSLLPRIRGAR
jgi:hypothetical protein